MNIHENQIVVYQPDETIRLDVRLENETVWLTQEQMCELFQRDRSVITKHVRNVFSEGECDEANNVQILRLNSEPRFHLRQTKECWLHGLGNEDGDCGRIAQQAKMCHGEKA